MFNTAAVTVAWTENKPDAQITAVTPSDPTLTFMAPGETLTFSGTDNDPSTEGHTYHWDFGDGASSTTETATHAYTGGGVYTVTLTVTDDEGTVGLAATTTVKILTPQQSLDAMVRYVQGLKSLNAGQQNSLIAKLKAASDALARGNNRAAHNELSAFINELDADLKTGKISAGDYNALRADAHSVQGATGTYNRFLEWWPLAA
jgi:PKD repeat protein